MGLIEPRVGLNENGISCLWLGLPPHGRIVLAQLHAYDWCGWVLLYRGLFSCGMLLKPRSACMLCRGASVGGLLDLVCCRAGPAFKAVCGFNCPVTMTRSCKKPTVWIDGLVSCVCMLWLVRANEGMCLIKETCRKDISCTELLVHPRPRHPNLASPASWLSWVLVGCC